MLKKIDRKNRFVSMFDPNTGFYMRSGIIDENGNDTGVDPFMSSMPELVDIGVMGWCMHGQSGLCIKSGIECYQNGLHIKKNKKLAPTIKCLYYVLNWGKYID